MSTPNPPASPNPTLVTKARTVHVPLGDRAYDVVINTGVLAEAGPRLAKLIQGRRCLVISDRNTGPRYGPLLAKSLQLAGFDGSAAEIPSGESLKVLKTAEFLYDRCMDAKLDRDSVILALGGGVIGDLAGFVAATFYRGIAFVQVPTTLLAMVDASIGGKTGVDHALGKNAIGAFHQPKAVLIDPGTLGTLPDKELRAGLAEVIKYGVIDDPELFDFLEKNMADLLAKKPEALAFAIERSAAIKARIVGQDERESHGGPRALLNYGHTFGHALETCTDYKAYLHGEAVAIGMRLASDLSVKMGLLKDEERERIIRLIRAAGLPDSLRNSDPETAALHAACFRDKKVASGKLRFILAHGIGKAETHTDVKEDDLLQVWNQGRAG